MSFFCKPYNYVLRLLQRSLQIPYISDAQVNQNYNMFILSVRKDFIYKKRTFCCASLPGVMTVEAAVVLPLFLAAILSLLNIVHMLGVNQSAYMAMARSAHILSVYGYAKDFGDEMIYPELVGQVIKSEIDFSQVSGGAAGINYYNTGYDDASGEISLSLRYRLKSVIDIFKLESVGMHQEVFTRAFIGGKMLAQNAGKTSEEGVTIYVAENGVVYHKKRECAYIDITLNAVISSSISGMRNSQGGKYYPCEHCENSTNASSIVYVSNTGNRYHTSAKCNGVKRTVYEMTIADDCILPACSRCGK